jgi:hypothetical protein
LSALSVRQQCQRLEGDHAVSLHAILLAVKQRAQAGIVFGRAKGGLRLHEPDIGVAEGWAL